MLRVHFFHKDCMYESSAEKCQKAFYTASDNMIDKKGPRNLSIFGQLLQ